jgi:hypothetical protein
MPTTATREKWSPDDLKLEATRHQAMLLQAAIPAILRKRSAGLLPGTVRAAGGY